MYNRGNASPKAYSSDVTKHSDYFVWKNTTGRMARRCDDTVDKKRVNSCVLEHLFLEEVESLSVDRLNSKIYPIFRASLIATPSGRLP